MASKVILKKSSVAARVPVAGDLAFGELALNYADGLLYYKKADGTTIASIGSSSSTDTLATITARGATTSTALTLGSINVNGTIIGTNSGQLLLKSADSASPSDVFIRGGNATADDSSAGGVQIIGGTSTNSGTGTIIIGSNSIGGDVYLVSNTGTVVTNASSVSINSTGSTGTINNMSIGATTASTGRFTTVTTTTGITFPDGTTQTTAASGTATATSARTFMMMGA